MSTQNLLVAFNGSSASIAALKYAAATVRQNDGHVTALLAHASNEVVNSRDAWDGGRAASRALSDSLVLLKQEGSVTLTVGDNELPRPIEVLMQHLQRKSVEAQHHNLERKRTVANTLIAFCEEHDPCVLVMGAYEYSKFREDSFGGLATDLLKRMQTPLLISH